MSIHRLIIELLGKDKASDDLKRVSGQADKMAKSFGSLQGILGAAGVAGFGYLAKQAADAAWGLGQAGAEALRTEASFDRLSGRIGTTGDALRSALKTAADGTVDNMTLMQTTAGLLASGIQTSTEDMVLAMEIAQLKAQQFGLTTSEAYDRMLTGARKFSVEMLDELGINLRATSVYKRKADALGVAVDALTDAQKAESLWQAILEDGREEIEQYGGAVDDYATSLEQAETKIIDAKLAIEKALTPAVATLAGEMANFVTWATGGTAEAISDIAIQSHGAEASLILLAKAAEEAKLHLIYSDEKLFGVDMSNRVHLLGEELVALGIKTGASMDEIRATAENLGIALDPDDWQAYFDAILKTKTAVEPWIEREREAAAAAREHAAGLEEVAEAAATATTSLGLMEYTLGLHSKIMGMIPEPYLKAMDIIRGEQDRLKEQFIRDAVLKSNAEVAAAHDSANAWEDSMADIRSAIESALQPTGVTALDMGLAGLGEYVEKWDENARRLDAVAARGFAELEAHPDWAAILEIPPNVLQAGEEALKSWARQTAGAVRDLTRPDLLNVDAAVAAVQQYYKDMAAKELSLDLSTQAVIEQGIVTGADAKEQVAKALGLEEPTLSLGIELATDDLQELSVEGQTAVDYIMKGYGTGLETANPAGEFGRRFLDDVQTQAPLLEAAGAQAWKPIWGAVRDAIAASPFVKEMAAAISPYVLQALLEQGVF